MKTSQPASRLPVAAALAIAAGLLTGALWSSQPVPVTTAPMDSQRTAIDSAIPSITITAKRLSKAEKQRQAMEEIDPTLPHLTVIGYRERTVAALGSTR